MIEITLQRARHGRSIKMKCHTPSGPITVVVHAMDTVHVYSPGTDMTHEDWALLSEKVAQVIAEIRQRNGNEKDDETPSL